MVVGIFVLLPIALFATFQLNRFKTFKTNRQAECQAALDACTKFYRYCRAKGLDDVESDEWKEMIRTVHAVKLGWGKF